ncbi:aldose epimerase family protein [Sutcliffiella deserti]|uniref:aldose epimerase family protein n=1 Tax=Sutcliffiella deserti TaxID=2875501 RepID=UPI001CBF2552|nr:aldose epimerase family protein [Sutcliffiella deserti]
MKISKKPIKGLEHTPYYKFNLTNENGIEVEFLNLGCVITKILMPDRLGKKENIVLGFKDYEDYLNNSPYLGVVVGRVAGRIGQSKFSLDKKEYIVTKNEGNNHLHGGKSGFSHVCWNDEVYEKENEVGVVFTYLSKDGEEGYPGNLSATVRYALTSDNRFTISYEGFSDKQTIYSPTNHTYFNLSGNLKRDILKQKLKMPADWYLPLSEDFLPSSNKEAVDMTEFDFREGRILKDGIESSHPQISLANGYDHFYILNKKIPEFFLLDVESGRKMSVATDSQGLVLYTGNHLSSNLELDGGKGKSYLGVCLETQSLPVGLDLGEPSNAYVKENDSYYSFTEYRFSIVD